MALTATRWPTDTLLAARKHTCEFVFGLVDGPVAAGAKFLLEEVVVLDVAGARLNEPGLVHAHHLLVDPHFLVAFNHLLIIKTVEQKLNLFT